MRALVCLAVGALAAAPAVHAGPPKLPWDVARSAMSMQMQKRVVAVDKRRGSATTWTFPSCWRTSNARVDCQYQLRVADNNGARHVCVGTAYAKLKADSIIYAWISAGRCS